MGLNFGFVTTFSDSYHYGIEMCRTMEEYLPDDCNLTVFYEGKELPDNTDRITYLPFPEFKIYKFKTIASPHQDMVLLGKKPEDEIYDKQQLYRFDAIRFAWKIYAMNEFHNKCPARYMVWIDADVHLTSKIPDDFLFTLVEEGKYASYLNRDRIHTESGFLIYDTEHPHHLEFWKRMMNLYDNGQIFKMSAWTDCHAFDYLISRSRQEGVKHKPLVDTRHGDHAWNGSPLHKYSRHFKGLRNKQKLDAE